MKTYLQILIFFFGINSIYAQTSTKTLLWEVRKNGNANVSYIFGTYHTVSPNFFDSLSIVIAKLTQSDILYVEEEKSLSIKSNINLQREEWNPNKWKSFLSQSQDSVFKQFVQKSEDTSLYYYSPLVVLLNMNGLYTKFFCETDLYNEELMDHHIETLARNLNKKVFSLDTLQSGILNSASTSYSNYQTSLLVSACIRFMSNMLTENLKDCALIYKYKQFNIDYELETDFSKQESPNVLLLERNTRWIKILKDSFQKNNCFVAVGLRHLFYKQGLIQQLRNLGFSVAPVSI